MNYKRVISFTLLIAVFILSSCSIEKRHYRSGYNLTWKKNIKLTEKSNAPSPGLFTASADKDIIILTANDLIINPGDSCDTIVFKNQMEMKAKVLEINQTEVKYKRCDYPEGPTYSAEKDQVVLIKYKNGIHEKISSQEVATHQTQRESINLADSCALIVTTDSTLIKGRIIEIRSDVIKYRYCDPKMKNIYVIKRSFVSKVLVSNGKVDVLNDINNNTGVTTMRQGPARNHGSAVVSMILGIASFGSSIFGVVPALIAIILGLKANKKINEEPAKYKGLKMAKAGIICGAIDLFLIILVVLYIAHII